MMKDEPKGPYFLQAIESGGLGIGGPGRDVNEYLGLSTDQGIVRVRHLNEGYQAGRASRDGLRKALKRIAGADYRGNRSSESVLAFEALAEDEKAE